jgi:hypothetical protein
MVSCYKKTVAYESDFIQISSILEILQLFTAAQTVEPSARWKGISKDNFTKIKNKKNNNNIFLFYLGLLKMELPKKKRIFNIFQIW